MKHLVTIFSFLIFLSVYSFGQIINVPDDQPTIQAAINASVNGDTVLVADGLYFENINFRGKAITVASHFLIDSNETHIDNTIINGSRPNHPDSASVVQFHTGEDTTSVLYGFTITGGKGSIDSYGYGSLGGGGIAISSGAKIQFNKITGNTITDNLAVGGGIVIAKKATPVLILDNYITNNKLISPGSNTEGGGGIFCYDCPNSFILISDNVILENLVSTSSGSLTGYGGGINLNSSNVLIKNNLIKNNKSAAGGGIGVEDYRERTGAAIINNSLVNNEASLSGGGIYSDNSGSNPEIINSIVWGNTSPHSSQMSSNILVEYSNVEGGFTGTGNIDLDPLFADTTLFYLTPSSPCVDAGNMDNLFNDLEDQNNLSFALFPALGGLRNDMGHCGGNPDMYSDPTAVESENSSIPQMFTLKQNYPNPFNPTTIINYSIPKQSFVTLKIFDILGKEVRTLVKKQQSVGNYEVQLNANNLSSGVYFYKIIAGDFVETKKMILLR